MIRVCDAIMGSGKTEAAITFMNKHPEKKFVYVSPFLDEASRIYKGCPDLHFVEPSDRIKEHGFSKAEHTLSLIKEGRNITSTHSALSFYTKDTLDEISARGYTLIIDEELQALTKETDIKNGDVKVIVEAGYMEETEPGTYKYSGKPYDNASIFRSFFRKMLSRDLFAVQKNETSSKVEGYFYWAFPKEFLQAFEDVYVLTYMFEGQELWAYMKMCGFEYELIGVKKNESGEYDFGYYNEYIPEYVSHIRDMVEVFDKGHLNRIGDRKGSLSMNWYKKKENTEKMQKHLFNYFNMYCKGISPHDKMYGCFKKDKTKLRGGGYSKGYVVFNERATNKYRNMVSLAYCVNVYLNVGIKLRYKAFGIKLDDDRYALSTMVQWIWRSAIRDGKPIILYVPSKRMRTLLSDWMDSLQKGVSMC